MHASAVPSGVLFAISRFYARLLLVAYRRPVLFRPRTWLLGLAAALVIGVVLASLSMWVWLVVPGILLGLAGAGVAGWQRLMRPSDQLIVAVIARFAPSTAGAHNTTVDHQLALLDSVRRVGLDHVVEARKLSPIRRREAETLIAACPARVVVYGEARVPGTRWLAMGGILVDSSRRVLDTGENRYAGAPPRHESFRDHDLDLNALAGDFTANHVEVLHAELINLATALRQ